MEFQSIDVYCERLSPEFWAEPANAISNLGFVLVGIWALGRAKRGSASPMVIFLSAMVAVVGLGSFLFHTYANTLSLIGDLLPIFIFTSAYLYHSLHHYLKWSRGRAWIALAAVILSMLFVQIAIPNRILNGSLLYLPPLIALFAIANAIKRRQLAIAQRYQAAAIVFTLSLALRTIDFVVCDSFPMGTHFLWHLLNGACLGLLMLIAFQFDSTESRT
ncbi:MAG: ceramidase domain-containing protein [Bdellovibrionaceae bacterium]|nr:ceramidase domain-containing protein [Pseudobdellovibrionaceae bacterium]